jgi:hypothetical protein
MFDLFGRLFQAGAHADEAQTRKAAEEDALRRGDYDAARRHRQAADWHRKTGGTHVGLHFLEMLIAIFRRAGD